MTEKQEKGTVTDTVTTAEERNYRKTRQATSSAGKMDKTVVVDGRGPGQAPLYGKVIRRSTKIKAHDEETLPVSATAS